MKVATWNVNSLRARLDHVIRWSRESGVDVLCLQELKLTDKLFPAQALREAGWSHMACWGQPTYNGVAILSRHPLEHLQRGFDGFEDPQARVIAATVQGVRIYNLYTPNGQAVGSPKFLYKLRWLRKLQEEVRRYSPEEPLLVCGDMNIAPDDLDVWDPFEMEGELLCHPDERAALAKVLDHGLTDAFRHQNPFSNAFSWWSYQAMAFPRNQGVRIDHIYLSKPLMARCGEVHIHQEPRAWDHPSDHAPVMVELR